MKGLLCTRCMAGTVVDIDGGTVCTHCRAITARPTPARPSLHAILAFAQAHPRVPGDGTVRRELGVSVLRYVQLLNRAIDDPEAAAICRPVVDRLRDERDRRDALRRGAA